MFTRKMSTCINNPNESSTAKIKKHTPLGYSIFTHCSFDESKTYLIIIEEMIARRNFVKI